MVMEMVWKGMNRKRKRYAFGDWTGAADGVLPKVAAKWPPRASSERERASWFGSISGPPFLAPKLLVEGWDSSQNALLCPVSVTAVAQMQNPLLAAVGSYV